MQVNEQQCKDRGCIWDSTPRPPGVPICYLDPKQVGYKVPAGVKKTDTGLEADLHLKDTAKRTLKSMPSIESIKFSVKYMTENILRFTIRDPAVKRYEVPVQQVFNLMDRTERDEQKRRYAVDVGTDLNDFQFTITRKDTKTKMTERDEQKRRYAVDVGTDLNDFQFTITRKDTKTKIFDTSIGGLVFADQFLQLATNLATNNVYGFGENVHQSLRHDLSYKTWPLFARDVPLSEEMHNHYGVHPFYTVLESDGKAHGILFLNSNAMDYTLLPQPALSLKSTGGVLDFFVFVGDNPEHVIQLYTSVIGRSTMPPFWGLGYQLCRYGFTGTQNVRETIDRNIKEKIPLDVMYLDIDYMENYEDFTYDKHAFAGLPELFKDTIAKNNLHWTLMLDAAIEANNTAYQSFNEGYKQDVFIKWSKEVPVKDRHNPPNVPIDKDTIYGKVWPYGPAAFPDFFKSKTDQWWHNQVKNLHDVLPFDALWIDMNEPSNFNSTCTNNKYDFPPIRTSTLWGGTGKQLSQQTICMTTTQGDNEEYSHYDVHSLYGVGGIIATQKALHATTGKRGFVVSRSTYPTSGRYGTHWLGDNKSYWKMMHHSVVGMLEFNMFGISFVGSDICGFIGETNPQLCRRWSQLGAFYPFSRNHNEKGRPDQDPAVWVSKGHPEVTEAARSSLQLRYQLLHYLYTLFYRSYVYGNTVARPLFHEWPQDVNTHSIDSQFMWGRDILISPFLFENQQHVAAYLPPGERWHEVRPQLKLAPQVGHITIQDTQPNGPPPVHFRSGAIIPMVTDTQLTSTTGPAMNQIDLVVVPNVKWEARGELFWDDREGIDTIDAGKYNLYSFTQYANCTMEIHVSKAGYTSGIHPTVRQVLVQSTGVKDHGVEAKLDGKIVPTKRGDNGAIEITVNLSLGDKLDQRNERGCIWDSTPRPPGVPICYLDPKQVGYKVPAGVKKTDTGLEADLHLKDTAKRTLKSMPSENLNNRLDCYLEFDTKGEHLCKERGCIWDSTGRPPGVPICYLDPKQVGYKVPAGVKKTDTGLEADLKLKDTAKRT
ncbi:unnamed protein product, partial [Medioppia subpectinata]